LTGVRFTEIDQVVSEARGEAKAYPDAESSAHCQGGSRQDSVNEKEQRSDEEKGELDGFGDSGQEGGERRRDQDTCRNLGEVCVANHSQAGRGRPNIMMGKNPAMKFPAVGSPAK